MLRILSLIAVPMLLCGVASGQCPSCGPQGCPVPSSNLPYQQLPQHFQLPPMTVPYGSNGCQGGVPPGLTGQPFSSPAYSSGVPYVYWLPRETLQPFLNPVITESYVGAFSPLPTLPPMPSGPVYGTPLYASGGFFAGGGGRYAASSVNTGGRWRQRQVSVFRYRQR